MTEKITKQRTARQTPSAQPIALTEETLDQVQGGRSRGDTTLGDVVVVKELDKSTA